MTKKGKIYKIKNIVNHKEYVGCTISTLKKRFEEHIWRCLNSDSNTKFCNSIRKYGVENFMIELIEECDVINIYEREKFYIDNFNTYFLGLNSTYGGEGCLGYTHSKEIKDKISKILKNGKSHKGKTYEIIYGEKVDEERKKRSESVKNNWKNMSPEEKEKRVKKVTDTIRKKSLLSIDQIKEIKNKLKEGIKIKELKVLYPKLRTGFFYELKNNRRWKNI